MIYIPSFVKIGSGIQKSIKGGFTDTAWRSHRPTFIFQNKESRLRIRRHTSKTHDAGYLFVVDGYSNPFVPCVYESQVSVTLFTKDSNGKLS
jgi:hypothetical protein